MATTTSTSKPLVLDVERPPLDCCQAPFFPLGTGTARVAQHRPGCHVLDQRALEALQAQE